LARLRRARSAAGTSRAADNRHLVLVRDKKWSNGEKTQHALAEFRASGGLNVDLSKEDVRTFWALDRMLARGGNDVHEWLVDRRPASRSGLLSEALPKSATGTGNNGTRPPPLPAENPRATTEPATPTGTNTEPATEAVGGTEFPLGNVRIELESLRQHTRPAPGG
ncbi:AAA family ATPase, partial [Kibdelosporangium lantanae]